MPHTSVPIYFILGVGRSGTTLLSQMLNANPYCLSTPERQFIMTFYNKYAHKQPLPLKQFIGDISRYYQLRSPNKKHNNHSVWHFDQAAFKHTLHTSPPTDYQQVCRSFLLHTHYLQRSNDTVQCIVDKNPNYTLYTHQLLTLFPDTQFIVTQRDYRAVWHSHLQSADNRYTNPIFLLLLWKHHYQHLINLKQTIPHRLLWISYEQLSTQPKINTQTVCQYLGIPWHDNMLSSNKTLKQWADKHSQTTDLSVRKHKKWSNLTQTTYTHQQQSWRKHLSIQQIALADWLCGNIGKQLGYLPETQLNKGQKMKLILCHLPQLIYGYLAYWIYAHYYYLPLQLRMMLIKYLKLQR
ncbi:MAG: sulfotransferase [Chitinophagales bacterium]|nr:sulfotransferase [Chitinophagales bacterium]